MAILLLALLTTPATGATMQDPATVRVSVVAESMPLGAAMVSVNGSAHETDAQGLVTATVPPGKVTILVTAAGFPPASASLTARAGQRHEVVVTLERAPEIEEAITVSATRTDRRVGDQPIRVEVIPEEEIQEKVMMTPGGVSMLLNETNGLRVQTTSPSLGGANVRIQGMRGRYTQILSDGLPLYGGQTGSIGLLQIPPMDLRQVEVIKGVASALYGVSALGGIVNLVSRRPGDEPERAVLLNRTSHAGTDAVAWISQKLTDEWGVTLLGGTHWQERSDLDGDGWTDLPFYGRAVVRPRLYWDNGAGASLLLALGATIEDRRGGTMPGAAAIGGQTIAERVDSRRFDSGAVARVVTTGGRVLTLRGSTTWAGHEHTFGEVIERDRHDTAFGEASLTGRAGPHTWVAGAAVQRDAYRSRGVPRFDYSHVIPAVFAQDDYDIATWLAVSASGRLDVHADHGALASPRISALVRGDGPWSTRVSAGRGYFVPTPFTEETEATGLTPVAGPLDLRPERADSLSADLTWARRALEVTGTLFSSRVRHPVQIQETGDPLTPFALTNAAGPTRAAGTEVIARFHRDEPELDIILTHMYVWSTERDPGDPDRRREVPLNPRHSASLDVLGEIGPVRVGLEVYLTGRQALEDNPYRDRGRAYVVVGTLVDWNRGRANLFLNAENLGNVRQTRFDPLLRPTGPAPGRVTVDAWAPLEGRTVNGGVRVRF